MEVEDDVFFADLNKQISLLIMDDEDKATHHPSVSVQAFSRAIHPAAQTPFCNQQTYNTSWESKGTGVFIPQSSLHPRRKNSRQPRFSSSSNSKFQRQYYSDNATAPPHYASSYTNDPTHNNASNPRR